MHYINTLYFFYSYPSSMVRYSATSHPNFTKQRKTMRWVDIHKNMHCIDQANYERETGLAGICIKESFLNFYNSLQSW